jgi:hypothetical protein
MPFSRSGINGKRKTTCEYQCANLQKYHPGEHAERALAPLTIEITRVCRALVHLSTAAMIASNAFWVSHGNVIANHLRRRIEVLPEI